jgi:hypothetical protein
MLKTNKPIVFLMYDWLISLNLAVPPDNLVIYAGGGVTLEPPLGGVRFSGGFDLVG